MSVLSKFVSFGEGILLCFPLHPSPHFKSPSFSCPSALPASGTHMDEHPPHNYLSNRERAVSKIFRRSSVPVKWTFALQTCIYCALRSQDILLLPPMWVFAKEAWLIGQQASRYLPASASHLIIAGMTSTCHTWIFNVDAEDWTLLFARQTSCQLSHLHSPIWSCFWRNHVTLLSTCVCVWGAG